MKSSVAMKFVAVLLAAVLANSPAYACSTDSCVSPCNYTPVIYDPGFDQYCSYWVFTSGASRVDVGSNTFAQLTGFSNVYQQFTVSSSHDGGDVSFGLDVVPGSSPGTERLYVEIVSSSNVILDTLDVIYPSASDGRYDYNLGNYAGQTIRLRLRRGTGNSPGDTVFRIDWAHVWTYDV